MAAPMVSSSSADDEENTPERLQKSQSSKYKRCYCHITSVEHEEVEDFTTTRWSTYRTSLQRWLGVKGECLTRDVAENHKHCLDLEFENIPRDAGFHPTCYRRFTDKNAVAKVERRLAREREQEVTEDHDAKKLRSGSGLPIAGSGAVLPALCIICKKKEKLINKAGKRQRDPLSKAETLTAGHLQKAAELKEDHSILMHIKDKDCVALEVQYHRGCYSQYTRFLRRLSKPEREQNEPMFDVSYKIFCERIIRQRLLVNQEVLRMIQLWKAFIQLVEANEGRDASNYRQDTLKKRLTRDFPQLVFHIPTKRNVCELVLAETLSTDTLVDMPPYPSGPETTQSSEEDQTNYATKKLCVIATGMDIPDERPHSPADPTGISCSGDTPGAPSLECAPIETDSDGGDAIEFCENVPPDSEGTGEVMDCGLAPVEADSGPSGLEEELNQVFECLKKKLRDDPSFTAPVTSFISSFKQCNTDGSLRSALSTFWPESSGQDEAESQRPKGYVQPTAVDQRKAALGDKIITGRPTEASSREHTYNKRGRKRKRSAPHCLAHCVDGSMSLGGTHNIHFQSVFDASCNRS